MNSYELVIYKHLTTTSFHIVIQIQTQLVNLLSNLFKLSYLQIFWGNVFLIVFILMGWPSEKTQLLFSAQDTIAYS